MYTRYYSKHDPPPVYHHACGQPIELHEHTTGNGNWDLLVIDGQSVRYCPRCGKRIWRENLIHPDDMPKKTDATWSDYLDYQDMVRDLGPML